MLRRTSPGALAASALALFGLAALPAGASAQRMSQQHMVRIGLAGGVVVPVSDAKNALKTGVHAQGFALLNLLPSIPLRLNLGYQKLDLKTVLGSAQQTAIPSGTTDILSGVAGTQIELLHGPLRPYIVAGVGGFNVKNSINPTSGTTTSVSNSQFKFGVDGGAGIALGVGRLSAFVEGKVQNIYTEKGAINLKNIQTVPVSFGIMF